jgi:hypothetical protein
VVDWPSDRQESLITQVCGLILHDWWEPGGWESGAKAIQPRELRPKQVNWTKADTWFLYLQVPKL